LDNESGMTARETVCTLRKGIGLVSLEISDRKNNDTQHIVNMLTARKPYNQMFHQGIFFLPLNYCLLQVCF